MTFHPSLVVAVSLLLLAACGPRDEAAEPDTSEVADGDAADSGQTAAAVTPPTTLAEAVAGPWRPDAARARDNWRNPAETLEFFGIDPRWTVLEVWPGGGWYTDILAPWINAAGGTYVAAWPPVDPGNARATAFRDQFLDRFQSPLYGEVRLVEFGPESGALVAPGGIDAILTFRNVHNFLAAGFAEKAFADFYAALRPGGVLGVVEHRLPSSRVQDPRAASGYVQEDYVIALAREAGFELVARSDINANPADTADHPFGVWTLLPVSRTSPMGEPADPAFDQAAFNAIGESDRMTLLFRKPGGDTSEFQEPQPVDSPAPAPAESGR